MSNFVGRTASQVAKDAYIPVRGRGVDRQALGANSTAWFRRDPRAMVYTASKYKFVSKMFAGYGLVLEIGCGDGFGAPIVAQMVSSLVCIDYYRPHIQEARYVNQHLHNTTFEPDDFLDERDAHSIYDGAYCLDVIEHLDPSQEYLFFTRVKQVLRHDGAFICGMPTLASQEHASTYNRDGHINCQTPEQITATLTEHFSNVFSFGMNDEVVHTGFDPMRQYQLNLCTGPRK